MVPQRLSLVAFDAFSDLVGASRAAGANGVVERGEPCTIPQVLGREGLP